MGSFQAIRLRKFPSDLPVIYQLLVRVGAGRNLAVKPVLRAIRLLLTGVILNTTGD